MAAMGVGRTRYVQHVDEPDAAVVCAVVVTAKNVAIVVNVAYPDALAHAELHVASGREDVWICGPDCRM